ncbi:MAG: hypothetical protein ACREDP_09075, partial [Bradyrhizobium sp.]
MGERRPPFSPNDLNQQPASGRISAVVDLAPTDLAKSATCVAPLPPHHSSRSELCQSETTNRPLVARLSIIAAALFLMGVNDMSNHAKSYESTRTGAAPEGWS